MKATTSIKMQNFQSVGMGIKECRKKYVQIHLVVQIRFSFFTIE